MTADECLTCGHPGLRPHGHADWCARVEAMTPAERSEATIRMAAAQGIRHVSNSPYMTARIDALLASASPPAPAVPPPPGAGGNGAAGKGQQVVASAGRQPVRSTNPTTKERDQ